MKKVFFWSIIFVILVFIAVPHAAADSICSITVDPSSVTPDDDYQIQVDAFGTAADTSTCTLKARKDGEQDFTIDSYSCNTGRIFYTNVLPHQIGNYEFIVFRGSQLACSNTIRITEDASEAPESGRLCWSPLENSYDCHNYCLDNPPTGGDFETQTECLASIPTPTGPLTPTATIPPPPPPCLKGIDLTGNPVDNTNKPNPTPIGHCTEVSTAFGPISTDPQKFIKWLFGFLLGISGGIALLIIMASGYTLMTSQGDPEKIKGAQENLTSAIVGLLFMLFSFVILEVIGVDILQIPGLGK